MNKNKFEWDDNKLNANIKKHGIDFVDAIEIFSDIYRIENTIMHESGEERHITIGMVIWCRSFSCLYSKRQFYKANFSAEGE